MIGCRAFVCGSAALGLMSALLLGACNGTESGNPSLEFSSTECKSGEPSATPQGERARAPRLRALGHGPQNESAFQDDRYDGLTCFVWERLDAETVNIQVTNHADGCSENEHWRPEAELTDDGKLDLRLENPSCSSAKCGWCIYDLSFTVKVPRTLESVEVRVFDDSCSSEGATVREQAHLALGQAERGEVCGYANPHALRWRGCTSGAPGRFLPCGAPDDCFGEGTHCAEGLTCVELDEARCAPSCTKDADCTNVAQTSCVNGACVLQANAP